NLCKKVKAGVARAKLVGKIFCNMAIEEILSCYGKIFDRESCRRKRRIFKILCERVLHECSVTPQKRSHFSFKKV
ncbi:PIPO, partial [East Asian Passiflora virus]|uniref:PIPO n=1 Tax=East Asian Passiflora virus TaxID=341167 RepID=UPI00026512FB